MPITLQEAKVGMVDKVLQLVIDEFRRGSLLLDQLTFDDAVSPGTGGSTMTYGYTQLLRAFAPSTPNIHPTKPSAPKRPLFENFWRQCPSGPRYPIHLRCH